MLGFGAVACELFGWRGVHVWGVWSLLLVALTGFRVPSSLLTRSAVYASLLDLPLTRLDRFASLSCRLLMLLQAVVHVSSGGGLLPLSCDSLLLWQVQVRVPCEDVADLSLPWCTSFFLVLPLGFFPQLCILCLFWGGVFIPSCNSLGHWPLLYFSSNMKGTKSSSFAKKRERAWILMRIRGINHVGDGGFASVGWVS